jgi:putative sporulation protein YyaC
MSFLPGREKDYSVHYADPSCYRQVERVVYNLLIEMNPGFSRELIFLCVGTDRATGDCLGPLVGTRLRSLASSALVFGTLEKPTHASNLQEIMDSISAQYRNPLIVAVDASLGNNDRIGYINVKKGGLKPGTALKKILPEVGDFHISAVVNVGGFLEQMVLQNTRLYIVYQMAEVIARSLHLAFLDYERYRKACLQEIRSV